MHRSSHIALLIIIIAAGNLFGCTNGDDVTSTEKASAGSTVNPARATISAAAVLAANLIDHEVPADYAYDTTRAVRILLNGTAISESSDSVSVTGTVATITAGGVYVLSGALSNGQVAVNAPSTATVWLVLRGVSLTNTTTSPLCITAASKAVLVLADNTQNVVTDGSGYVFPSADDTEPNAAVFSKTDLTICGNGSLIVNGNYNDGIASKDGLIIKSGTITVNAADDGIRGKDYLIIRNGVVTVNCTGDGLKADNDEDAARGYILLEAGTVNATCGDDAFAAQTDAIITGGICALTTGGGSSRTVSSTASSKGIKGMACVVIGDGTFTINAADDAIHSNSTVVINGGTFAISSGDDAIHADTLLGINGGDITIAKSYEGIESDVLVINDGSIRVTASDDGVNGAGGNDGSGAGGWPGGMPAAGTSALYVNGGYVAVNATGDGIDINGSITMTNGTVIVHGPTSNANGPIDYDASFAMSGGTIVAAGSSGMAMTPSASSAQNSVLVVFTATKSAGTLFHIQGADSTDILTFKPGKTYQSVAFCSPLLKRGSSYTIYVGGSSTGTVTDGRYEGGTYSGGTKSSSFMVSAAVTKVNG